MEDEDREYLEGGGGGQEGESWEESCLNKFSKCLGMSLASFEVQFLLLMSRISERRQ